MVYGTGLTALIQGALVGIAFLSSGLPSPLVFGVIAALTALLPFGGTALVWVPAAIVLAAQGRMGRAIFMVMWGALLVSLVDNVVRPMLVSGRADVGYADRIHRRARRASPHSARSACSSVRSLLALIIALIRSRSTCAARSEANRPARTDGHTTSSSTVMSAHVLRIATRQSRLALWQAEHVAAVCASAHPDLQVVLVPMTTQGDRILDRPLAQVGGKGLFIKELEARDCRKTAPTSPCTR